MMVIFFLIAAGGAVAGGFLAAFIWAVRSGQFDDTTTPPIRMLLEEPSHLQFPANGAPPPFARAAALEDSLSSPGLSRHKDLR